jgi:uncharacterized membrane protein YfcA
MRGYFFLLLFLAFSCEVDSDCELSNMCSEGNCVHKSLFPLESTEILGSCLIFFISGLAGATGIGGGVLYVICFVMLFGYNASDSVAFSQFTIMGTAIIAVLLKVFLRHPTKNKPLIDYDIVIVIISPLLAGTTIGVVVNIVLPYWLILLILTGLMCVLFFSTYQSSLKLYRKENTQVRTEIEMTEKFDNTEKLLVENKELKHIHEKEKRIIPLDSLLIILPIYFLMIFMALVRGSQRFPSVINLEFCSALFWCFSVLMIIIFIALSEACTWYMLVKHKKKAEIGYDYDRLDIKWEKESARKISLVGLAAGFIGSLVGVGGALIVNPVLLKIGIRPEVMTATSSFMVLFASTISSLQYILAGKIDVEYGLWTLSFSFIGSALGVLVIKRIVEYYKRSSIIAFTLAFSMGISAIIIPIYGIINLTSMAEDFGFHNYCKV